MNYLQTIFLDEVTKQLFRGNALIQKCVFKYRFNPDYKNYPHSSSANELQRIQPNIADLVAKELNGRPGDYSGSIAMQISAGINKLYKTYGEEMEEDGVDENQLKSKPGQSSNDKDSPWQVAYKWLWKIKYPRWSENYLWESWKQVAQNNSQWIQFNETPKYTDTEATPKAIKPKWKELVPQKTIPINTSLNLKIELDCLGSYLYLFNRGVDTRGNITKYLIAPSQAFAPQCQLLDEIIIMPQKGAMCEDIEFDAVGQEEYLGIVVDKPLPLSSFNPDPSNPALEWEGTHLGQVWEQLQDKNWRVFYRDFEVVSSEDLAA